LEEYIVSESGIQSSIISDVGFHAIFNVVDSKNYFICNIYPSNKIINCCGYNIVLKETDKVMDYTIQFDPVYKNWLFAYLNDKGIYYCYIIDKNQILIHNNTLKFSADLGNINYNRKTIYTPNDKKIIGLSLEKMIIKEFPCNIVDEETELINIGGKFKAIKEREIYEIG
jgi:hypothetical protein